MESFLKSGSKFKKLFLIFHILSFMCTYNFFSSSWESLELEKGTHAKEKERTIIWPTSNDILMHFYIFLIIWGLSTKIRIIDPHLHNLNASSKLQTLPNDKSNGYWVDQLSGFMRTSLCLTTTSVWTWKFWAWGFNSTRQTNRLDWLVSQSHALSQDVVDHIPTYHHSLHCIS